MNYFVLYGDYDYDLTIDVFDNEEGALGRVAELEAKRTEYVRVIKGVDLEVKRSYSFVEEGV